MVQAAWQPMGTAALQLMVTAALQLMVTAALQLMVTAVLQPIDTAAGQLMFKAVLQLMVHCRSWCSSCSKLLCSSGCIGAHGALDGQNCCAAHAQSCFAAHGALRVMVQLMFKAALKLRVHWSSWCTAWSQLLCSSCSKLLGSSWCKNAFGNAGHECLGTSCSKLVVGSDGQSCFATHGNTCFCMP